MAQVLNAADPTAEQYDIFLCTRIVPDKLTPETAALRQLCSALVGSGYRVFYPTSALAGMEPEAQAQAIAAVVQKVPVMLAAAVGDDGARDNTARFLWNKFRALAQEDPGRVFLSCARDVGEVPPELLTDDMLDMGELEFLVKLKDRLAAALPEIRRAAEPEAEDAPEPEDAPEEEPPAEKEAPEEELPAEADAPAPGRSRRWAWIALAAAAVVIVALIIALCVK